MQATYFDGVSSQPRLATISIQPSYIEIHLHSEERSQPILWDHAGIQVSNIPGSSKTAMKYGSFPFQCLEVEAQPFYEELKATYPEAHYLKAANNFSKGLETSWLIGSLTAMIGIALSFYFLVLPFLVEQTIHLIPTSTEEQIGQEMADRWLSSATVDEERTEAVNQFYQHLATNSKYDIHISVVEDNIKNAFALPGGQIVIYTGLLNEMETYPELVALLGHETGHIEKRHTLKSMVKSLALYLGVSMIFQDLNGVMAVLVDNVASLQQLSYSRSLEEESDEFGLQLMLKNHVDPKGMKLLFERLKDSETGVETKKESEFLATHPSIENRIKELENKLTTIRPVVVHNDSLQCYWEQISMTDEVEDLYSTEEQAENALDSTDKAEKEVEEVEGEE